jgi:hypothetical protein
MISFRSISMQPRLSIADPLPIEGAESNCAPPGRARFWGLPAPDRPSRAPKTLRGVTAEQVDWSVFHQAASGKRRSSVTASYRDLAAPLHNTDRVSARREVTAPARAPIFWWEYADFTRRVMPDRVATSKPPCVSTLLEYHVVTYGPIRF